MLAFRSDVARQLVLLVGSSGVTGGDIYRNHTMTSLTARESLRSAVFLTLSIAAAVAGQGLLREFLWDGLFLFAVSLAFLAASKNALISQAPWSCSQGLPQREPLIVSQKQRRRLLAAAVAASAVVFADASHNDFSGLGLFAYGLSIALFLAASADRPHKPAQHWQNGFPVRFTSLGLGVILLSTIAFGIRVFDLPNLPGEMTSDHTEKLLDVQAILDGNRPIYLVTNGGRESLQAYLTALLIGITPLDLSFDALKWGTILIGILAIPLTCLLGRELFGPAAGILAGSLLTISHWHVATSRIGLRYGFSASVTAAVLYFLWKALRTGDRNAWILCGVLSGLALHTYQALRVVPVLVLLIAFGARTVSRLRPDMKSPEGHSGHPSGFPAPSREGMPLILLGVLIVASPLLRFAIESPEIYWARLTTGLGSSLQTFSLGTVATFFGNLKSALLMFNLTSDRVWINSPPDAAALGNTTAALFLIGITILVVRFITGRDPRAQFLMVSLTILLLPSTASLAVPAEVPSLARAAGTMPVVFIIAALPLALAWKLAGRLGRWALVTALVGLSFIGARATLEFSRNYFVSYAENYERTAWNASEIGQVVGGFAHSIGRLNHAFITSYPHWVDYRLVGLYAGDIRWPNLLDDVDSLTAEKLGEPPLLFIVHPEDESRLSRLRTLFPHASQKLVESWIPGKNFAVIFVPEESSDLSPEDAGSKSEGYPAGRAKR